MLGFRLSLYLLVLFLLISCGGGGDNSSQNSSDNFSSSSSTKTIDGLVVDGYIRNAEVWLETTDDFSNLEEIATSSDVQGRFSFNTSLTDYRIQSLGGIDLDTNNSLDGLFLINDQIDKIELNTSDANKTWENYIVSPLTTAEYFLAKSLSNLEDPITPSINELLGLNQNLNVNISNHVSNINNGFMYAKAYEKGNQLTSLVLSLTRMINDLKSSSQDTNELFQMILDKLALDYQSSQTAANLESPLFLEALIENINTKFNLSLQEEIKIKLKSMLKAFIPLIQVKPEISATKGIFNFATSTFFNDLISVASNRDTQDVHQKYNNSLIAYISEITGISTANLAFSISANSDSVNAYEDQIFNIDVLQNDDFDSQSSFNILFTQPQNGSVTKNNSNILVYTPNQNFNGNDIFSYTLQQGSLSSEASVNINVQAVNDAPIISLSSNQITVPENLISVTSISASDADGDNLTFSLSGVDASYFSITSSGALSFINAPDYETKSSFLVTVSVSDGVLSDNVNLAITVSNVEYEIDLLVYYAPDMLTYYSSESNIETRVLYLITSANNALTRSKSEVQFNLLKLLPYDIDVSNQSGTTIFSSLPGRAKIKKEQVLYGADYFILLSRWDAAKGTTGGTANIDLAIDNVFDSDSEHVYLSAWSVYPNWSEVGCNPCFPDKVFSHELGHNLGSGHWPGETGQSYAFGHRVDGNTDGDFTDSFDWGTVMSYNDISPDHFSNPNIACKDGLACGVLNVSDNIKWYNNLGSRFSAILPPSNLDNLNTSNKINIKNYFPKISGGTSTFSNAGNSRAFLLTEFSDVEINGQTYRSFKWENSVNDNPKMAYHFYEKDSKYFINRTDYESGYYFSNQDEYTLYDSNNLCIFFDSFKSIGNYLSRTCKNAWYGSPPTYNDVYHFNHFIKTESITVPFGTFESVKYVFSIWDNFYNSNKPYLMHTIFWLNPEMGIVQYQDHLGRIWKLENTDSDGDGLNNLNDNDDDNDGVLDNLDAFKLDPTSYLDSNFDGIPD